MPQKSAEVTADAVLETARARIDPLIFWLVRQILPGRIPFWLQSLLASFTFGLFVLGGLTLAGEPTVIKVLLAGVGTATILAQLISFETSFRWFFRLLDDDILPNLPPPALAIVKSKIESLFGRAKQIGFVVVLSGISTLLLSRIVEILTGQFSLIDAAAIFVISAVSFDLIYFVLPLLDNVHLLEIREAELYPLDPRSSPALKGSTAIVSNLLTAIAICASVAIVGLVLAFQIMAVVPALLIVIALLLVAGFLFVIQQSGLSGIVARRKALTIADLQTTLTDLYERASQLTDDERKRFDYLLNLRDRLVKTGESALTFGTALRFIAPMLLPLVSFLSSSGSIPALVGDALMGLVEAMR